MRAWRSALIFIAALSSVACNSPQAASQPQSSDLLFFGDPNATKSLAPWDNIQIGGKNSEASKAPAPQPDDPGTVAVVPDPLGIEGNVYKLKVTPTAGFHASSHAADRVDLWNLAKPYMGQEGQETWEHFRMLFPSKGDAYKPSIGEWNWVAQHHNDDGYIPFEKAGLTHEVSELVWGIDTRSSGKHGKENTQLFMVIRGGDDRVPAEKRVYVGDDLRYDHWYDMLVHVVWSHDSQKGLVEWWLDGRLLFSDHIADLWQRPDGKTDHVNFEFSNYRIHSEWPSSIYYSKVKLGLTRESVSF